MAFFSAGSEPAALCSVPFLFTSASLRPNRHPSLCPQCHGNDPALPPKLFPLTPPPHTHNTSHSQHTHMNTLCPLQFRGCWATPADLLYTHTRPHQARFPQDITTQGQRRNTDQVSACVSSVCLWAYIIWLATVCV